MKVRHFIVAIALLPASAVFGADAPAVVIPPAAARQVDFVKDIKPLFEAACIQCHAKGKDKGGLSLETREAFLKGGDTGPAAIPGNGGESLAVKLVAGADPDGIMPKKGTKWTPEQIGLLRAWIDQGAKWDPSVTFARPGIAESAATRGRGAGRQVAAPARPVSRHLSEEP